MEEIIEKVEKKAKELNIALCDTEDTMVRLTQLKEQLENLVEEMEIEAILTRNRVGEETDLQRFLGLYKSFGIELKVEKCEPSNPEVEEGFLVELKQGSHPKLKGYTWFFSTILFDKSGKFIEQGFWE